MIDTVNVLEKMGEANLTLHSWTEGKDGNKEAEECFTNCLKENDPDITDVDIEACLDNGYYEANEYQLFLVHSS
jgi:hypothetical protein